MPIAVIAISMRNLPFFFCIQLSISSLICQISCIFVHCPNFLSGYYITVNQVLQYQESIFNQPVFIGSQQMISYLHKKINDFQLSMQDHNNHLYVLGPTPAFGRLGLGGSSGGYSSHGYTSHASLRAFGAQLEGDRLCFRRLTKHF